MKAAWTLSRLQPVSKVLIPVFLAALFISAYVTSRTSQIHPVATIDPGGQSDWPTSRGTNVTHDSRYALSTIEQPFPSNDSLCRDATRLEHLRAQCDHHSAHAQHIHARTRLIVQRKTRVLYCSISKAGCTQVKGLMEVAATGNDVYLRQAGSVHSPAAMIRAGVERHSRLNDVTRGYTKVLLVRNPFERAISAYRNLQVGRTNLGPEPFVYTSIKKAFPGSSSGGMKLDKLTFDQYIQFVTDPTITSNAAYNDRHFLPMANSCDVCNIQYDLFLRIENFESEAARFLQLSGLPLDILTRTTKLNASKKVATKSDKQQSECHKQVPEQFRMLSKELFLRFIQRYYLDFKLFGYEVDIDNMLVDKGYKSANSSHVCC